MCDNLRRKCCYTTTIKMSISFVKNKKRTKSDCDFFALKAVRWLNWRFAVCVYVGRCQLSKSMLNIQVKHFTSSAQVLLLR